jgi:pimeloyl-ACP methyl ester carboxylesterase
VKIKEGVVHLQDGAKAAFYSGLSTEKQDEAWASIFKQHSLKCITDFPTYIESDFQAQKFYFVTEDDHVVPPSLQEQMARTGGYEIVRIASGHSPALQCPERLVDEISKVAYRLYP